jgi:hypothetical protein
LELSVDGAGPASGQPDQFSTLKPPFWLTEKKPKHTLLDRSEES